MGGGLIEPPTHSLRPLRRRLIRPTDQTAGASRSRYEDDTRSSRRRSASLRPERRSCSAWSISRARICSPMTNDPPERSIENSATPVRPMRSPGRLALLSKPAAARNNASAPRCPLARTTSSKPTNSTLRRTTGRSVRRHTSIITPAEAANPRRFRMPVNPSIPSLDTIDVGRAVRSWLVTLPWSAFLLST